MPAAWWKRIFTLSKAIFIGWTLLVFQFMGVHASQSDGEAICSKSQQCAQLDASCWTCRFPSCKYGAVVNASCSPAPGVTCQGETSFAVESECRFCYQTDPQRHVCDAVSNCSVIAPPPRNLVRTVCTVRGDVVCMGQRRFPKRVPCRWTSGHYKWSTALILSITLGGFGVDRFYLGLWRSGLGKLFSFGGLGVWTIVDVILIAIGYIGPSDESLYLY